MNKKCPKCGCFLAFMTSWCGDELYSEYYKCNNKNCDWLESDEVLESDF